MSQSVMYVKLSQIKVNEQGQQVLDGEQTIIADVEALAAL